jgi:hypothetical protein
VRTPPYVSFKSLLTLIEELKTSGLPPQIDRSVLRRFSGGLGSQLLMASKSLGLVDANNAPTQLGADVVEAFGTDEFKPLLKKAVLPAYPFLAGLDLMTATPSMFAEAFKAGTGAKEDVLRKCRTFFLHAAQYVGIPLGPRILNGSIPRSSAGGPRRKATRAAAPKPKASSVPEDHSKPRNEGDDGFRSQLITKFPAFDPSWPDEIKAKWFDGFGQFMEMTKK